MFRQLAVKLVGYLARKHKISAVEMLRSKSKRVDRRSRSVKLYANSIGQKS